MILQLKTQSISEKQLINKIWEIYAELMMMKKKCVKIDKQQSQTKNKLNDEQWQILIAFHWILFHEHHDFFLISQHSAASLAVQWLVSKYEMSAWIWWHEIHIFLKLLRYKFLNFFDHMLIFIYTVYNMLALLMKCVSVFENIWIECLNNLVRYQMIVEKVDHQNQKV